MYPEMVPEARSLRPHDDGALVGQPAPRPPARRPSDPLSFASRTVGLLLKLTCLAIAVTVLVGVLGLLGVGGRATTGVGDRLVEALGRGAGAVSQAVEGVRDLGDPAHPPRQALAQDAEFNELMRLDVGSPLADAGERTLVVAAVQRREGAESADAAVYATIHSELRTPRETLVLGIVVRTSRDPQDYYLYKGESFRVGRRLYKVNWVSLDRQQIAIAAYRDPDRVTAPLKFEID